MKGKKADIVRVAAVAKVSISTVSRYFNHPELVNPSTRKRIDAAVRKTGYIRNRAAQTIHGIRSGTIGVIIPTLDHAIFAEVVQAFSDTVAEHGFTILLASHGYDGQREYKILRKLLEHRVDGIVLTGLDHSDAVFQLIESQSIPHVLIWNYSAQATHPCVGADNTLAGQLIAKHVLDLGHRKIASMFPPVDGNDRANGRLEAVLQTLRAADVEIPPDWQLTTVYSLTTAKRDATALMSQANRPSVLICGNDVLATGALYAAAALGLRVPQDISVVGIGDFKGSADVVPPLTTVRLPAVEIGQTAGHALSAAIIGENSEITGVHCLPSLIKRASCGAV